MPTLIDHFIIVILVIALPAYAAISLNEKAKQALRESGRMRVKEYWKTSILQWVLVAGTLVAWFLQDRAAEAIGFVFLFDWRFWLAILLSLLIWQQRAATQDEDARGALRDTLNRVAPFMPRTGGEFRHFIIIAVTAGVCEEILYRGYLFWYLSSFIGTTALAWTAVVFAGAVIFGLAHSYQGRTGIVQVFVVALVMGGLYLLTRSLWIPMLAHAIIDLHGGAIGLRVLGNGDTDDRSREESVHHEGRDRIGAAAG